MLKNQLQRWAIGRFLLEIEDSNEVHILNRRDADKRLDMLHRLSVLRAALFGLISGMFVVFVALWLHEWEGSNGWNAYSFFFASVGSCLSSGFIIVDGPWLNVTLLPFSISS